MNARIPRTLSVLIAIALVLAAFCGGRQSVAAAASSGSSAMRYVECSNPRVGNAPWRTSASSDWRFSGETGTASYVSAEDRRFFPEPGDECGVKTLAK